MKPLASYLKEFRLRLRLQDGLIATQRTFWIPCALALLAQIIGRLFPISNLWIWTLDILSPLDHSNLGNGTPSSFQSAERYIARGSSCQLAGAPLDCLCIHDDRSKTCPDPAGSQSASGSDPICRKSRFAGCISANLVSPPNLDRCQFPSARPFVFISSK